MPEFLSAEAMRALENSMIESGKVTGATLMERAGEGVVKVILTKWPALTKPGHAVVLCGPGNNGGDGFVVARLLEKTGWSVRVFFYGIIGKLPPDARLNYDRWHSSCKGSTNRLSFPEVSAFEVRAFTKRAYQVPETKLVIDALFGIGLTRPPEGLRPILESAQSHFETVSEDELPHHVSIDLPSGLAEEGPMGVGPGWVFPTHLTVTFHSRKEAHRHGTKYCGDIMVQDIGL